MDENLDLSIVIPSYNSADWLPTTLASTQEAIAASSLRCEVVLIDDGSTDSTAEIVEEITRTFGSTLRYVHTPNSGVFAARLRGANVATSSRILFLDSRVLMNYQALSYLQSLLERGAPSAALVGHVATDESAPLVGRFWEVPTHVFWGKYLRDPQVTTVNSENFDKLPKGTGFLLIDRHLFLDACSEIGDEFDRFVSDDTKLLRIVTSRTSMTIDPEFRAVYRPRTTVRKFLAHGLLRGTLFVDSYYGTSIVRSLALWIIALSLPVLIAAVVFGILTGNWIATIALAGLFVALLLTLTAVSRINRAPLRACASFLIYAIPFTFVFWAGITRGLWLRMSKRGL